jgi:hypothetical protein
MKLLVPFFVLLISCKGQPDTPLHYSKFVYKFHDSSVPPEYHRSFTITVTKDSIAKFVDSYGDTISYEKKSIPDEKFLALKKLVTEAQISNCPTSGRDNCTGGTGISIYLYEGNKQVFKGYAAQCGGQNTGDMCGNFELVLSFLNKLIPKEIYIEPL